jgi:Mg-chelatase subunit ChlD
VYKALAGYIDAIAQENEGKFSTAEAKHKKAREAEQQHGKGKATIAESNGWEALYVVKPDLVRSHTGKLGRRSVYTGTGRSVKNVSRLYSDPEQRIFTRKTRALGAVVVFDCSGSMSLDR